MKELLPDVFTWSWLSPPHGYLFNGHLLKLPGFTVVVDPVQFAPQEEADNLHQIIAARPSRVLLTNRNHSRMANLIRESTGALVAIHPDDAAHARAQGTHIDEDLLPGQWIGALQVVAAPGKSPGEVALHWPERRALLVGDVIIGNPPGRCSLLREQVMDDPALLRTSVRALLHLSFDALLVGDGDPILSGAHAAVKALVATFPPSSG